MGLDARRGVTFSSPEICGGRDVPAIIKAVQKDTLTLLVKEPGVVVETASDLTVRFEDGGAEYRFETKAVTAKPADAEEFNILRPTVISRAVKRSHKRVPVDIPVEIGEADRRELVRQRGRILDLSGGGALVEAAPGRNVGDVLKLNFVLPNGERMDEVAALVMWMKPVGDHVCRYGLAFHALSEIRRGRLVAFVEAESRRTAR